MADIPPVLETPAAQPRSPLLALVLVLAVAALLRLAGVLWGLPGPLHLFSYHPDEYHSLRAALSLLVGGDANPHFFNYGSLYLYLTAVAAHFTGTMPMNPPTLNGMADVLRDWTLAARLVNVVLALLTVVVVYRMASLVLGYRLGLTAALALAAMPLHVLNSVYATVDVPLTFFVALTLLFAVQIALRPTVRSYVLAGIFAGLAASTKYSGALVVIAPLLAHFLADRTPAREGRPGPQVPVVSAWPLVMLILVGVAFAATSPYTLLDWPNARQDIVYEMQHMRAGEEPARSADPNGWLFHALALTMTTTGCALAAVLGAAGLARYRRLRPLVGPVVFGLAWFAVTALANVRYLRYDVPLTPLLALLCAAAPLALWQRRPGGRLVALLLPALAIGLGLGVSARIGLNLRTQADPRDLARDAVIRKVPPDRAVGMVWEPWFQSAPLDPCNGGMALRRNPFWGQFQAPARPLVFLGLDAAKLAQAQPLAVVVSNFEVRDAMRVGDPEQKAFARALTREYQVAQVERRAPPLEGLLGWQPPQDWMYAFPTIMVYLRKTE